MNVRKNSPVGSNWLHGPPYRQIMWVLASCQGFRIERRKRGRCNELQNKPRTVCHSARSMSHVQVLTVQPTTLTRSLG